LFSLAIKAIERPRTKKKEGKQEPQKKQSKTEGRNPAKQRERKYTEKNRENAIKETQKTNINITISSNSPCKSEKGRTQAASCDLHHHRNKRKTKGGNHTLTRTKSPSCKPPRDLQKQVSHSHSLHSCLELCKCKNCAKVI